MASDLRERRLRPVYDAIDNGQYKQSLQLCTKLLKKQEDHAVVKALMALTLGRMDRKAEALQLAEEARAMRPVDEETLQALTYTYKPMQRHSQIVEMYEHAVESNPRSLELHAHLFMACARGRFFKKQQQVAVKMNKLVSGHNMYLFWNIMSLLLQVRENPTEPGLSLQLAEKMIKRAIEEKKLESFEEFQLFLMILEEAGKQEEALKELGSDLGKKVYKVEYDRRRKELDYLVKLKQWKPVHDLSKELMEQMADDTKLAEIFFNAVSSLAAEDASQLEGLVKGAREFIATHVQKESAHSRARRGPFLNEMEFEKRFNPQASLADHIAYYFKQFGGKSCCFTDLRAYLGLVPANGEKDFLAKLQGIVDEVDIKISAPTKIRMGVCLNQIIWCLRSYKGDFKITASDIPTVDLLVKNYQEALPHGEKLEPRELQYADEYLLLAVHYLIYLFKSSSERAYLLQAVALLERGMDKSKFNFQMKLLAIRLYTHLGVYNRVSAIYDSLETKHVQLDTLSFFLVDNCLNLGAHDQAVQELSVAEGFYRSNVSETPEMVVLAFKNGTFSKISEFLRFFTRVDNSLHKSFVALDLTRHDLLYPEFLPHNQEAKRSHLDALLHEIAAVPESIFQSSDDFCNSRWDNRDNQVMVHYNTPQSTTVFEELQTENRRNVPWFQLNTKTIKVLHLIVKKDADMLDAAESLEKLADSLVGKCFEGERIKAKAVILTAKVYSEYKKALDNKDAAESDAIKQLAKDFAPVFGWLEKVTQLATQATSDFTLALSENLLVSLSLACEISNHLIAGLAVVATMNPAKKGKKGKGDAPTVPFTTLEAIKTGLNNHIKQLENTLQELHGAVDKVQKDPEAVSKLFLARDAANIAFVTSKDSNLKVIGSLMLRSTSDSLTQFRREVTKKKNLLAQVFQ